MSPIDCAPRRSGPRPARRFLAVVLAASYGLLLVACGGGDPDDDADASTPASSAPVGPPQTPGATSDDAPPPAAATEQPPLPADPSGYTPAYVQATLEALFLRYQEAITSYHAMGTVDDTVRAALAEVYHPDVLDQQVRNLEDYFPGGDNLEDPPGPVSVTVTEIHSVSADCILAITTYDIDAVTTLDAPAVEGFFIGLARNPGETAATDPWLITVEYSTSDDEPLPEDVCA